MNFAVLEPPPVRPAAATCAGSAGWMDAAGQNPRYAQTVPPARCGARQVHCGWRRGRKGRGSGARGRPPARDLPIPPGAMNPVQSAMSSVDGFPLLAPRYSLPTQNLAGHNEQSAVAARDGGSRSQRARPGSGSPHTRAVGGSHGMCQNLRSIRGAPTFSRARSCSVCSLSPPTSPTRRVESRRHTVAVHPDRSSRAAFEGCGGDSGSTAKSRTRQGACPGAQAPWDFEERRPAITRAAILFSALNRAGPHSASRPQGVCPRESALCPSLRSSRLSRAAT
ncbi:hypothetical protein FHS01_005031 [Longimicrobium terrae]|uniref:Uncharacterized protein n=1 Tax=Longimicrobium terrae TaxID=1639882 RepID=A0A841H5P5_9BACT|nr:hypothetical protein [Longimicrobium terrae]MBB6073206.1 hypothetical protein [Longimicrobium terrae]